MTTVTNPQRSSSQETLKATLVQLNKTYGPGTVMRMSERPMENVPVIPTGSLGLDRALGVGGLPAGRIVEIFGTESAGKSTLALSVVAEAQRKGGQAAYVDTEHALDPIYAQQLGVDLDKILISQPDSAEQALEISEQLIRSGSLDVLVLDSVAALVPAAELNGEMGDTIIGGQARLMSQAMRKLTGAVSRASTVAVFINQLREKIGVMFGNREVTPGGRALKFHASVRVDLRRMETLKNGTEIVGNRVRARVVKNKVAPPFRTAEMDILFNRGISKEGELLDIGSEMAIVEKRGAFYSYDGTRLGQGKENARGFLLENRTIAEKIETAIRKVLLPQPSTPVSSNPPPAAQSASKTTTPEP